MIEMCAKCKSNKMILNLLLYRVMEFDMKFFSLLISLGLVLFLQGCASMPIDDKSDLGGDYDVAKISAVERHAQRYNLKVYWVHYPPARDK
jgi:hypothetical protein